MTRAGMLYRPRPRSLSPLWPPISFGPPLADPSEVPFHDIAELVDALTGAPLDPALGLYRCKVCKVFYQGGSHAVLQSENAGRCVSCLQTAIVPVTATRRGRNSDPSLVTLANYRGFVGRVITFQGFVHAVLVSRRGTDYALMFEDKPWVLGFKMVVFRRDVAQAGGRDFLFALEGKAVRVRGLLVQHPEFGYEIIVSERSMILDVR